MIKKCSKCNVSKPMSEFNSHNNTKDKFRPECKLCQAESNKKWRMANKEKVRKIKKKYYQKQLSTPQGRKFLKDSQWKCKLKIKCHTTAEEYKTLFLKQEGKCAICGIHQKELKIRLCADHCHKVNKIRGLLCSRCNRAVGLWKDDPEMCIKAYMYLQNNRLTKKHTPEDVE